MSRLTRILLVTGGLSLAGALFGGLAGSAVGALMAVVAHATAPDMPDPGFARVGALVGAMLGTALLPVAAWVLMRRVPIGRALLGTLLGTVAGALVGGVVPPVGSIERMLLGALVGFAVAVLLLRRWSTSPGGEGGGSTHGAA